MEGRDTPLVAIQRRAHSRVASQRAGHCKAGCSSPVEEPSLPHHSCRPSSSRFSSSGWCGSVHSLSTGSTSG